MKMIFLGMITVLIFMAFLILVVDNPQDKVTQAPTNGTVEASVPEGFILVSSDKFDDEMYARLHVLQHVKSGCYFTLTTANEGVAFTQMFEEYGNSVSVPYCE